MKTNFKSVGSAQKYSAFSLAGRVLKREVRISVLFAKGMDRIYVPFYMNEHGSLCYYHIMHAIDCQEDGGSCIDIPGGFG